MSALVQLPSGIVTFVLTDIEGSTRLLRRLGDRYPEVLERHHVLLQQAWTQHGGHEVDCVGDSVMAVFADAAAALAACALAQVALGAEPWPAGGEVRVRMGVHSGLAAPREGRYVALGVHQAARVMSAAHGGQVLVSADAVTQLSAIGDLAIVPVGHYRLRDFDEPVQLFELSEPRSSRRFPGVRAMPADGHNLVSPPTSFVGRETEVDEIVAATAPGRLVTLTGPGGVGKTRLAIEAGHRAVARWPDEVWFVDLTTLDDPAQLSVAIGDACGVPSRAGDRWRDVLDHLRDRQSLVILDNCEHLGPAVGDAVATLLAACVTTGVLATGREPLGLVGESVRRVDPLRVPDADDDAGATPSAAVLLFVDRARAARADFAVDDATAPVVAEICRRLDGLPLALELAAARLSELTPEDVLRGLRDRFRLLRTRQSGMPERQRTMEQVLEWSDRLLDPATRTCLRCLGVFGGSFSLDAAAAAVGADGIAGDDVPELVWSLVDKSLVVADLAANHTRYRLLESVRDFALRRLEAHAEVTATATRLADWYLEWVGPDKRHHKSWPGDVAVELDNLRALVPLVAPVDEPRAQALAATIGRYLGMWQSSRTGIGELRHHLQLLPSVSPERVGMLAALADLHLALDDLGAARGTLEEARAVAAAAGGHPPWDDVGLARVEADLATRSGDPATAIVVARAALASDLSVNGQGRMWCQLGLAAAASGDLETAAHAFEEELAAWTALGDEALQAAANGNLAETAIRRGDLATAAARQLRSLDLSLQLGAQVNVAFSLILAARIAAPKEPEIATVLHARAEALLDRCGVTLYESDRRESDEMLAAAREALGTAAFGRARSEGVALDIPAAAALAERVLRAVPDH